MRRIMLLIAAVFVFLAGCGGGGGGGNNPPSDKHTIHVSNPSVPASGDVSPKTTVEVPANTFSAPTDVTVSQTKADIPTQLLTVFDKIYEIKSNTVPSGQLNLIFRGAGNSLQSGEQFAVIYMTDNGWKSLPTVTNGSDISASLPSGTQTNSKGVFSRIITGVIVKYVPPDSNMGLVRMSGTGNLGEGSAIVVHGICSNHELMQIFCDRIVANGLAKNVYALVYPWTDSPDVPGKFLADRLNELPAKSVDIYAHSMGVLVTRYALETLGATKSVKTAVLINGPNEGTLLASVGELYLGFEDYLFNNLLRFHSNTVPGPADLGSPVLATLTPGSDFLNNLNQPRSWLGDVNYKVVGATADKWIVSEDSALGSSLNWMSFTGGTVERIEIDSNHNDLVQKEAKINELLRLIAGKPGGLTITFEPDTLDANDSDWGPYTVHVRNDSGQSVHIDDMEMTAYNGDGEFVVNQWYTTDVFGSFPYNYTRWDTDELTPGAEAVTCNIWFAADGTISELSPSAQAYTIVFTARGTANTKGSATQVFHYGSIYPSPPNTRSPHKNRSPIPKGFGFTSKKAK